MAWSKLAAGTRIVRVPLRTFVPEVEDDST
jgi:hypothetical protein